MPFAHLLRVTPAVEAFREDTKLSSLDLAFLGPRAAPAPARAAVWPRRACETRAWAVRVRRELGI